MCELDPTRMVRAAKVKGIWRVFVGIAVLLFISYILLYLTCAVKVQQCKALLESEGLGVRRAGAILSVKHGGARLETVPRANMLVWNAHQQQQQQQQQQQWPATVVSGFWRIPSKVSTEDYLQWITNSVKVNAPYIIFYDEEAVKNALQAARENRPTIFIYRPVANFTCYSSYKGNWKHPRHAPSLEVGMVWIEKMALVREVKEANPFNSEWFAWIDAGIAPYRDRLPPHGPWPSSANLARLPRDKLIHSGTRSYKEDPFVLNFSGGAYIMHAGMVDWVHREFYKHWWACGELYDDWRCASDQYVFSMMRHGHPSKMHQLIVGWGRVVYELFDHCDCPWWPFGEWAPYTFSGD